MTDKEKIIQVKTLEDFDRELGRDGSPDYARDLNSSEMWAQKKGRSSLI